MGGLIIALGKERRDEGGERELAVEEGFERCQRQV
jgi:hypothetical protein